MVYYRGLSRLGEAGPAEDQTPEPLPSAPPEPTTTKPVATSGTGAFLIQRGLSSLLLAWYTIQHALLLVLLVRVFGKDLLTSCPSS
jgi:hypothetical protein